MRRLDGDGNTDIDMLSMKNFYAIDIVDVDLAAQGSDLQRL